MSDDNIYHSAIVESFEKLQKIISEIPAGVLRDQLVETAQELASTISALTLSYSKVSDELTDIHSTRNLINVSGAVNVEEELQDVLDDPEFLALTEEEQRKIIVYIAQEKLIEENTRLTQKHSANSGWEYWYQLGINGTRQAFTETIEKMRAEIAQMREELDEKELSLHQTNRKLRKQERINKSARNSF